MGQKVQVQTRNVNSKVLFNEIDEFIRNGMLDIGVRWSSEIQRESFVNLIEDWLFEEFVDTKKITQFEVICDKRNNTKQTLADKVMLTISYKQKHCLNVTSIDYTIFLRSSHVTTIS